MQERKEKEKEEKEDSSKYGRDRETKEQEPGLVWVKQPRNHQKACDEFLPLQGLFFESDRTDVFLTFFRL